VVANQRGGGERLMVVTTIMGTAIGQARGAPSRGLSYINLDVRGDVFVDVDSHEKFNITD